MPTNIILDNQMQNYYDEKDADIIVEDIKKLYKLLDRIQTYFIKFYHQEKDYLDDIFNDNKMLIYALKALKIFWFNDDIFKYKIHDFILIKKNNDKLKYHITNENFINYITYFEIYFNLKNEIVFLIDQGHINFDIYVSHLKKISKKINDVIYEITADDISINR